jgi:hypothetical protein
METNNAKRRSMKGYTMMSASETKIHKRRWNLQRDSCPAVTLGFTCEAKKGKSHEVIRESESVFIKESRKISDIAILSTSSLPLFLAQNQLQLFT